MGILDKIKGLVGGNADKVEDGIDKAADIAKDKVGEDNADKVDMAADKAKEVVDGLGGDDGDSGDAEGGG
jgi:antitoxin protein of toxin-antitoxin system